MSTDRSPFKTPEQVAEQNVIAAQAEVETLQKRVEAEFAKPQPADYTYTVDTTAISEIAIQIVVQRLRESGWHVRRSEQREPNRLYITKPRPGFGSDYSR